MSASSLASSDAPESVRGMIAPHERNHVMRRVGYQPYLDFVKRVPDLLNVGTRGYIQLLNFVSEHRGIGVDELDPESQTFEANFNRFYDEINAVAYGYIGSGHVDEKIEAMLRDAFRDVDVYAQELSAIHGSFAASTNIEQRTGAMGQSRVKSPGDLVGVPASYAALLKKLTAEKAAPPLLTPRQRMALDAWNESFPEMHMGEEEFLER